jgi:hypothetical protein
MFLKIARSNKVRAFAILIVVFLFGCLSGCLGQSTIDQKKAFEIKMATALKLNFVSRDSDYQYSRLKIFNDTLVSFWDRTINDQQYKSYFIQSLKNPQYKIEFNNEQLVYPLISPVDYYRNGCLYFGKYLGTTMQTLCSDGTLTEYFNKNQDTNQAQPSAQNKVMIYRNQAVLSLNTGIYLFDIPSQKLIWKYIFTDYKGEALCAIFGNKLIAPHRFTGSMNVICYDLDRHELVWTKKIYGDSNSSSMTEFDPQFNLTKDNNNLIIPGRKACYIIDIKSGEIINTITWNIFFKYDQVSTFKIEDNRLYTTNLNDDRAGLLCIDIKTSKIIWNVKETFLIGLYKNYVVGYRSEGSGSYIIIDKKTGVIKDQIAKPDDGQRDFNFIDNYVLINHDVIYN